MKNSDEIRKVIKEEECACVFIDDSGSRGTDIGTTHMPSDRFSWVGVVVPPCMGLTVFENMDCLLLKIRKKYGADELHFVDIFNGKRVWKGVDVDDRMNIFSALSDIIVKENFYLFNRTLYETNAMFELARGIFPKFAGKDMNKPEVCALSLLLVKVQMFLEEMKWENSIVIIDNGIQKPGSSMVEKSLSPFIKDGEMFFCSSKDIAPLQIADFAAYSLSRSQVILGRIKNNKGISNVDKKFLKAVEPLVNIYDNTFIRLVNTNPLFDIKERLSNN